MIGFKQFTDRFKKNTEGEWKQKGDSHIHSAKVHGHHVQVRMWKKPFRHAKHYEASFTVNDKLDAGKKVKSSHAKAIIRHVTDRVKEFHKAHKPDNINWETSDRNPEKQAKKEKLYKALAKKHGIGS